MLCASGRYESTRHSSWLPRRWRRYLATPTPARVNEPKLTITPLGVPVEPEV